MDKMGEIYMKNIYLAEGKKKSYNIGLLDQERAKAMLSNALVANCVKDISAMTTEMNKEISGKLLGERNGGKRQKFIVG